MIMRSFLILLPVLFSSAVQCADDLSKLTDSQLCTEIGIAAAHKETSELSRLEEEGTRRDKLHITQIKPSDCNRLAAEAVNLEMNAGLAQQDEKLKETYNHVESLRKQAQARSEHEANSASER